MSAPTGSGKTVVGEHAVALALRDGGKAFYTAPIKALSNQKYADLVSELGPERVGLLTGDHAVNHLRILPDVSAMPFNPAERLAVWQLLASLMHQSLGAERARAAIARDRDEVARQRDELAARLGARRYRAMDRALSLARRSRILRFLGGGALRAPRRIWAGAGGATRVSGHS